MNESQLRVEIALRAGMMAKACLEMINLDPRFARLQLAEVAKQIRELDLKLQKEVR